MFNDDTSVNPWTQRNNNDRPTTAPVQSHNPCETTDPHPTSNLPVSADEAAAGYATYEFRRILAKIDQAEDEQALFWTANTAFGPNSFCSRFGEALSQTAHHRQYLPLLKQMMQAQLEDHLSGRTNWPPSGNRSLGFGGPELWEVGHHLRYSRINLLCDHGPLIKASETRDALLTELTALFTDPSPAFVETRASLDPRTREQWHRYLEKVKSQKTQAEAGWSLGMVFADVLTPIATLLKHINFPAQISEVAPLLTRFATALNH